MVNFWLVMKKELTLFYRRKSTTALLLVSPLFIILFLGILFGGGDAANRSLPVAVCNHDTGVVGDAYTQALSSYSLLNVVDYSQAYPNPLDCRNFLQANIKRGSFAMGMAFPPAFTDQITQGQSQSLEFFLDNSNAGLVGFQSQYVQAVTGEASTLAASQFVGRVLEKIRDADQKLEAIEKELGPVRNSMAESRETMAQIRADLNRLPDVGSLQDASNALTSADAALDGVAASALSAQQLFQALAANGSSQAQQGIVLTQSMRSSVLVLKPQITQARTQLAVTTQELGQYSSFKQNALATVDQVVLDIDDVIVKLDDAQTQIAEARREAQFFSSKDASDIVNPIRLSTVNVFDYGQYRQLDFVIYGILALIVILTSTLLSALNFVRERNSGAFVRVSLTPIGGFSQAFGKLLATLLVVAVQVAVVLGVAAMGFGVKFQNIGLVFAFALLLASAFVAVGLVIGSLTRSENSAILSVVALIIPLTFVSGLVIPYELMPATLQQITSLLPITFGINAMKYVSLYGVLPNAALFVSGSGFVELSASMLWLESLLLFFVAAFALGKAQPVVR